MDHYTKTSSSTTEPTEDSEPWDIHVKSGSKLRNIISQCLRLLQNKKGEKITIIGSGPTVTKAITCAEIIKRKIKGLHQINKLFYTKIEDTWDPKESELDKLQVTRKIPSIRITLSRVPLDPSQPGYQAPGKSKSPVQFRGEDWDLDQEERGDKTSERTNNRQLDNRSKKRNKGCGEKVAAENFKGHLDNGTDTEKGKRLREKEVEESTEGLVLKGTRKSLEVHSGDVTKKVTEDHSEKDPKCISEGHSKGNSGGGQNCGSQIDDKSKEYGHHARRDSGEKGSYKSKQSPRKKKKAE